MDVGSFIKTIENPVLIINTQKGKFVDFNEPARQLFGYSETEWLNLQTLPIYEDETAQKAIIPELLTSGEYYIKNHNGEIFDIYIIVSRSTVLGDHELVLFIRDITSENRQKKIHSFQRLLSNLSHLIARIAHEVRNPLGIITMNLQFLQQTGQDKDRTEINFALKGSDKINRALERLTSLANLSDCSQTDEDVNKLMMEALQAVYVPMKEKNLIFDVHLDEDIPAIKINAKQIIEVFKNILITVINYSTDNSTITITSGIFESPLNKQTLPPHSPFVVIKDSHTGVSIEEFTTNFNMNAGSFAKSSNFTNPFTLDFLMCNNARMQVENSPDGGLITRIIFSQTKNNL